MFRIEIQEPLVPPLAALCDHNRITLQVNRNKITKKAACKKKKDSLQAVFMIRMASMFTKMVPLLTLMAITLTNMVTMSLVGTTIVKIDIFHLRSLTSKLKNKSSHITGKKMNKNTQMSIVNVLNTKKVKLTYNQEINLTESTSMMKITKSLLVNLMIRKMIKVGGIKLRPKKVVNILNMHHNLTLDKTVNILECQIKTIKLKAILHIRVAQIIMMIKINPNLIVSQRNLLETI